MAILVAAVVTIGTVVPPGAGTAPAAAAECAVTAEGPAEADAEARRCGHDVEVLSARTEWNTLYAQPDGTMRLDTTTAATRTQAGGEWADVDNAVVTAEGSLAVASPVYPMTFSDGTGDEPLATIERNGHVLSFDVPFDLPAPDVDGQRITYPGVLPGVDLIVTVNVDATGFSEVLRVESPEAAADPRLAELAFPVEVSDGLVVAPSEGGFVATDAAGEEVFRSPVPAMWDSADAAVAPPSLGVRSTTSALVDALAVASRDAIGGGEPAWSTGRSGRSRSRSCRSPSRRTLW